MGIIASNYQASQRLILMLVLKGRQKKKKKKEAKIQSVKKDVFMAEGVAAKSTNEQAMVKVN